MERLIDTIIESADKDEAAVDEAIEEEAQKFFRDSREDGLSVQDSFFGALLLKGILYSRKDRE